MTSVSDNCSWCLLIFRWGDCHLEAFVGLKKSLRCYYRLICGTFCWWTASYSHMDSDLTRLCMQAQIFSILCSVQCSCSQMIRIWEDFGSPPVFSLNTSCVVRADNTLTDVGGKHVQIKACYPLLWGRLHIMMKGLALSICERIAHCCGGRRFIYFYFFLVLLLFLCIRYKMCSVWGSHLTWPTVKQICARCFHTCGWLRCCIFFLIHSFFCFCLSGLTLKIERPF